MIEGVEQTKVDMFPAPPVQSGPAPLRSSRFNYIHRFITDHLVSGLAILSTILVIAPLVAILLYLIYKGASSLNLAFFTKIPAPVGEEGGGMANSIVGSGIILTLASAMGIPIGIAAGVYLAEYGRGRLLGNLVRFTADVLNGVPSIVMGIAIYALIVTRQLHFSAFAGGVALAIMMIPTVTRTTEEMLLTVPHAVREAAFALGVPKWRTVISVSLRTASPGIILSLASAMGVPVGIAAGVYLAEYGRGRMLGNLVRFTADVLNGVPSIVMGIAIYSLIVVRQGHFSALAGGVALAIMMIPTVTRTTEEMLLTVPHAVREAALGLGVPKWRTVISVSLRTASPGIITGCMLAFARVAGETAPLLFTAFGNQFWSANLNQPIGALPLQIFVYAISPYDEWHRLAWAGALVLIVLIMVSVTLVRVVAGRGILKGNQ